MCLLKADCHGCEAEAFRSGKQLLEGGAVQARALRLETGYEGAGGLRQPKLTTKRRMQCWRLQTKVVQMEYDHSVASRASLEILQGMSPHPWQ